MAFVAGRVWHLRRGGLGKRWKFGFDAVGATGRIAVAVPVGMGFVGGPVPGEIGVVVPAAAGIGVEEPVVGKVVGVPVVTKFVGAG